MHSGRSIQGLFQIQRLVHLVYLLARNNITYQVYSLCFVQCIYLLLILFSPCRLVFFQMKFYILCYQFCQQHIILIKKGEEYDSSTLCYWQHPCGIGVLVTFDQISLDYLIRTLCKIWRVNHLLPGFILTLCVVHSIFPLLWFHFLAATEQLLEHFFPSFRLSIHLSIHPPHLFTMFLSSYHHEIFRSYYHWPLQKV